MIARPQITSSFRSAFASASTVVGGKIYDEQNVPSLSDASPSQFSATLHLIGQEPINLNFVDGEVIDYCNVNGDVQEMPKFLSQSCMKPLVYAMGLTKGLDVHSKIGTTGDIGYADHNLDPNGRALNPVINTGSLTLLEELGRTLTKEEIGSWCQRLGGGDGESPFCVAGYEATKKDSLRNRYIATYLACNAVLPKTEDAIERAVDNYAAMDCLLMTTSILAAIGMNLSNRGGEIVSPETSRSVVSMMLHCGMYESSGEWARTVGIAAKSGVSGCIFAAMPGVGGVAVHSPLIDNVGNSVRGMKFLEMFLADHPEVKLF